jgi:hypothetical protein
MWLQGEKYLLKVVIENENKTETLHGNKSGHKKELMKGGHKLENMKGRHRTDRELLGFQFWNFAHGIGCDLKEKDVPDESCHFRLK